MISIVWPLLVMLSALGLYSKVICRQVSARSPNRSLTWGLAVAGFACSEFGR